MKFENTLKSRATLRKEKEYEFPEFTNEEISKGREYNYDCPLFLIKDGCWYALYKDDKDETRLCIVMFHSWDKFKEIKV